MICSLTGGQGSACGPRSPASSKPHQSPRGIVGIALTADDWSAWNVIADSWFSCPHWPVVLVLPVAAGAAEIVDRNVAARRAAASNAKGNVALVTYRCTGVKRHVLYWGARQLGREVPARLLRRMEEQGRGLQALQQQLQALHRPAAAARDRGLRRPRRLALGAPAVGAPVEELRRRQGAGRALHLALEAATPASSQIQTDYSYHGKHEHLWGGFTFHGKPVFGNKWTLQGVPPTSRAATSTSTTSRADLAPRQQLPDPPADRRLLLHVREPPGLPPAWNGQGTGDAYRATAIGPGVTPVVQAHFAPPGPYRPRDRRGRQRRAERAARRRPRAAASTNSVRKAPSALRRRGYPRAMPRRLCLALAVALLVALTAQAASATAPGAPGASPTSPSPHSRAPSSRASCPRAVAQGSSAGSRTAPSGRRSRPTASASR